MSRLQVVTQLDETFNAHFADQARDVELIAVPRGVPERLPEDAPVMIAAPFHRSGEAHTSAPPSGWPFGLKWVQLVSVGIDFYPDWLFDGPVVTSARGASAIALAEFCLAAILGAAKAFPDIWIHKAQDWTFRQIGLVSGSTLGLVGFGAVGEALAPRAQALGMEVLAVRRSDQPIPVQGVERVATLAEVFARSDHVVLAAPSTRETHGLVDRRLLKAARPGLHLVNVARGALIDDEALLEALDDGRVSLASLDVTHPEPLAAGHRFYTHPRVRLSPHSSVHTPDTRRNLAALFADNLARFREDAPLRGVVDLARGY